MKIARKISGMAAALAIMVTGITGVTSTIGDVPQADASVRTFSGYVFDLSGVLRRAVNHGNKRLRYAEQRNGRWYYAATVGRGGTSSFRVCYVNTRFVAIAPPTQGYIYTRSAKAW